MVTSAVQLKRALLGERPRALLLFLVPTGLAFVLDIALRAGLVIEWAPQGKAIYFSSWAISAAFWALPLWCCARLYKIATRTDPGRGRIAARVGLALLFALWVFPFATCCYGGQLIYHRVVHAYVGRDTVRLGFALRGTVGQWFTAWGSSSALIGILGSGLAITALIAYLVRRAAPQVSGRPPLVPLLTFFIALFVFWIDMVDSRFLQAALPDDCFVHGVVHAVRVGVTGKGRTRRGVSIRTPAKLPVLEHNGPRTPNVVLILTESVRADALCSDPPPACTGRFLDEVAPDRMRLGRLTTPTPGTFGSCVLLWTGLSATADVTEAHTAPVLWELAHAEGYQTAYVTSQNLQFENFSAFFQVAGIDFMKTAADLGGLRQEQLGAPDERATEEMMRFVHEVPAGKPYFGVLHLSNTHAPYRIDPALQPFEPHSTDPLGDFNAFHNHYRNSVLLLERTISAFIKELRAQPAWDDTVVIVMSDHGEQFRERGGLYHLHSLYEEEVRIPGFMVAGKNALADDQRAAIKTFAPYRTYLTDINATIADLLGVAPAVRKTLPLANPFARSIVAPPGWAGDPFLLMSVPTAVWEDDTVRYGVMRGDHVLMGRPGATWQCFHLGTDPGETRPLPADQCGARMVDMTAAFPPL